jgi:hypothetical protein
VTKEALNVGGGLFGSGVLKNSILADDDDLADISTENDKTWALDNASHTSYSNSPKSKYTAYKACFETHPVLELGGGKVIGGRCSEPQKGADVYIGFDHSMAINDWVPGEKPPTQIFFPITDMQAPSNYKHFQELIDLCIGYLAQGKTIHCGCIGGHGRTGTFLAALVRCVTGNEDATTWVREHYCKKAVESKSQIEFLFKYFGIKKVEATKSFSSGSTKNYGGSHWPKATGGKEIGADKGLKFSGAKSNYPPVPSEKNLLRAGIL